MSHSRNVTACLFRWFRFPQVSEVECFARQTLLTCTDFSLFYVLLPRVSKQRSYIVSDRKFAHFILKIERILHALYRLTRLIAASVRNRRASLKALLVKFQTLSRIRTSGHGATVPNVIEL